MPYGAPADGTWREGPGFTGHQTDAATTLIYMQQRYYDTISSRFLSTDPVDVNTSNGANFNRFWYANNNPYRYTDPDGRESDETPEPPPTPFPPIVVTAPAVPISPSTVWPRPIQFPPISWPAIGRGLLWAGESFTAPLLLFYPSPLGAHPCEMPGGPPCGMMMSGAFPPGFWAGDKGAEEWGRRNGVGADEGRRRFHDIKQDDKGQGGGKGLDKYGTNPNTGDVANPQGEVVGNLGESG